MLRQRDCEAGEPAMIDGGRCHVCVSTILALMMITASGTADLFVFDNFCQNGAYYGNCFDSNSGMWRNNWGITAPNQNELVYPGSGDSADVNGFVVSVSAGTTFVDEIFDSVGGGGIINNTFLHVNVMSVDSFEQNGNTHDLFVHGSGGDGPALNVGLVTINAGDVFADPGVSFDVGELIFLGPITHRFQVELLIVDTLRLHGAGTIEFGTGPVGPQIFVNTLYDVQADTHAKAAGTNPPPSITFGPNSNVFIPVDHVLQVAAFFQGGVTVGENVEFICSAGGEIADTSDVTLNPGSMLEVNGPSNDPFDVRNGVTASGDGQVRVGFNVVVDTPESVDAIVFKRSTSTKFLQDSTANTLDVPGNVTLDGDSTGSLTVNGGARIGNFDISRTFTDFIATCWNGPVVFDEGRVVQWFSGDHTFKGDVSVIGSDAAFREFHLGTGQSGPANLFIDPEAFLQISVTGAPMKFTGSGVVTNAGQIRYDGGEVMQIQVPLNSLPGSDVVIENGVGEFFSIHVASSDIRIERDGIFRARRDLLFDAALVEMVGEFQVFPHEARADILNSTITNRDAGVITIDRTGTTIVNTSIVQELGASTLIGSDVVVEFQDTTIAGGSVESDGTGEIAVLGEIGLDAVALNNILLGIRNPTDHATFDGDETNPSSFNNVNLEIENDGLATNQGVMTLFGINKIVATTGGTFVNAFDALLAVDGGEATIEGANSNAGIILVESDTNLNIGSPDGQSPASVSGSGNLQIRALSSIQIGPNSTLETTTSSVTDANAVVAEDARWVAEFLEIRAQNSAELSVKQGAGMSVGDFLASVLSDQGHVFLFYFSGGGIQPGGAPPHMQVSRSFIFDLVDESDWIWDPGTVLALSGGIGSPVGDWENWTHLEIGGSDIGDESEGYDNNFDLSTLRIDAGAHAILEDLIDNGNRDGSGGSSEALYVDTLEFADSDGLLNVNGLHVYYQNLIGNSTQIIDIEVPSGTVATLTGFEVIKGTLLDGNVGHLISSDDLFVHTRSGFGQTFVDLHNVTIEIQATTTEPNPSSIDLTIETRIGHPSGIMQIRLRNWTIGTFDLVGTRAVNDLDQIITLHVVDASDYVQSGTGQIELELKQIVFVPQFAFLFESWFDWVQIAVE